MNMARDTVKTNGHSQVARIWQQKRRNISKGVLNLCFYRHVTDTLMLISYKIFYFKKVPSYQVM
jgi:hypothetical protein